MSRKHIVQLLPGDIRHNYVELLVWKRLIRDDTASDKKIASIEPNIRMHVTKFVIQSELWPVVSAEVGPGKYKTAMLLLYLAGEQKSSSFRMDDISRSIVRQYNSAEVLEDILSNPETEHLSVRALLSSGLVQVHCFA